MDRVTDYLAADHDRLDALLQRARAGGAVDRPAFAEFRAGLLRHIAIEEKVLLAGVRKVPGALSPEASLQLRVEHAALTSLLVPTPDPALLDEIAGLLDRHTAREEDEAGVFARSEAALGAASPSLAERARTFPAIPVAPHFDGAGVHRTAREALASAQRIRPPRAGRPS